MGLVFPDFANPGVWVSLLTLGFLEIVLGIDNVIFISIVSDKLPKERQRSSRNIGLTLAMLFRVGLLLCITWIIGLKDPVISIPSFAGIAENGLDLSYKDLILIAGGLFLIIKSTLEIHHKFQKEEKKELKSNKKKIGFGAVIFQIVLVKQYYQSPSNAANAGSFFPCGYRSGFDRRRPAPGSQQKHYLFMPRFFTGGGIAEHSFEEKI